MEDKERKGRGSDRAGEKNGHAKLSDVQIQEIRDLYATKKFSQAELAVQFGCVQPHISRIVLGMQRSK